MQNDRVKLNAISYQIIGAGLEVHRVLGPGVLEFPITRALALELELRGLTCARDVPVPVNYKGTPLGCGYRLDLLVEHLVIVEVKSVREINDIHKKQLMSYLKFTGKPLGLLINFNVPLLKDGITRIINTPLSADDRR